MATLVISEIKNSIRSPESDDLLQLVFVLLHASTFVRNQFYIFNFQITLKSIVTIFSVEHHYYKSNPNCERHGFTSPGASQAGSNIRKSNFQKFSLYSHTSWEIKKMHDYDGHEDCRIFYPRVRGSGLSFESIWPCSKNVLDLK